MPILTNDSCPCPKTIPPQPDMKKLFSMYAQVPVDCSADIRPTIGLYKNTPLQNTYYSNENVQIIQNGIRASVYDKSKGQYIISPQDENVIRDVMYSVFEQTVRGVSSNIPSQINELNQIVIKYCTDTVFQNAQSYMKYIETEGKIVKPMSYPIMSSTRDSQTYVLPVGVSKVPLSYQK
tara:strand:- start:3574 stop:4110 length:537 start_codon:yes stop_codon:yes gene_type:complete